MTLPPEYGKINSEELRRKRMKLSVLKRIKWIALILAGILGLLILLDLAIAVGSIYRWTHPEKKPWDSTPAEYGLDYYTFEIETEKGVVRGWKIAAQTPIDPDAEDWVYTTEYSDKTIVFAPNYDSNRELQDMGGIDYIAELCAAGYNVITFDWTGSGFSDGTKNVFTLDKTEELKAVVSFAAEETKASFIAVQGIGFGCYPAAVAAAECEQVDALILDSCYENFNTMFFGNLGNWSAFNLPPIKETIRLLFPLVSGIKTNEITLANPINQLNGKDVFFIQGEGDELFGTTDAKHLQSLAAVDNEAKLWLVSDALHLRTRTYDTETYFTKVSDFLTKAYDADHAA